jgi:hypothetical protein
MKGIGVMNSINKQNQAATAAASTESLRKARQGVPPGIYQVDADALRKARQGVPAGEYHTNA